MTLYDGAGEAAPYGQIVTERDGQDRKQRNGSVGIGHRWYGRVSEHWMTLDIS